MGEHGVEELLAQLAHLAREAGAAERVGVAHGAEVRGAPEERGRSGAVGERRPERLVEQDRREREESRVGGGDLEEGVGEGVAPLGGDARGGGVEVDQILVLDRAERADEAAVDLRLGQRAREGLEDRRAELKTLRGNSRLKNVASHFSYCEDAGST